MEFCICLLKNIKQINPNKMIVRFCVMPIGKALFRRRFQKKTAFSERKKEAVATAARFEKPHRKRPP